VLALIAHQCFQGREDKGEMWIVEACYLVAEGLPPACALNNKQALALNELLDDVALTWMKASADVKTVFE